MTKKREKKKFRNVLGQGQTLNFFEFIYPRESQLISDANYDLPIMTTSADSGSGLDAVDEYREGLKPLNARRYFNKSRLIHIILIDFFLSRCIFRCCRHTTNN